jgi:16S rRNA (uracil1498-N3)-methyltransferase
VKQFILSAPPDRDGLVRISGVDFHYLVHVRRLKKGDRFRAVLPGGEDRSPRATALAELVSVEAGTLTATLVDAAASLDAAAGDRGALPPLLLFQALPKGSKMDLIVRQAAEGEISEVVPFIAERSALQGEKPGRWERIIREALQQSGSSVFTALHPVLDWEGLFAYWDELRSAHPLALGIVLHPDPVEGGGIPLAEANLHRYLSTIPELLALAVGPEGGFSPAELSRFAGAGFKPLKIGNTVLRVETAALYGAAAARIILLENSSWTGNG